MTSTVEVAEWEALIDLCSPTGCRIWFYLEEFCLSLTRVNSEEELPEWLEIERYSASWDEILELDSREDERVAWAMEHGVAPGQAFLVEIRPPRYFKSGPYDAQEWDCEYNTTFVRAAPMPVLEAAAQWEEWIKAGYVEGTKP